MYSNQEIVTISLGSCGNRLHASYLDDLDREHGIDHANFYVGSTDLELERICNVYEETRGGRYVPRSIFVDLDDDCMEKDLERLKGNLVWDAKHLMFSGQSVRGTSGNWAKGRYTEGAELIDALMDKINAKVEGAQTGTQGFHVICGLGGGTGGGMGSLLCEMLKTWFPDKMICVTPVLSGSSRAAPPLVPALQGSIIEPYNLALSYAYLREHADLVTPLENSAMALYSANMHGVRLPREMDIRWIATQNLRAITSSWRLPCRVNQSMRMTATNLVPYPKVHTLLSGNPRWFSYGDPGVYGNVPTPSELFQQLQQPSAYTVGCDIRHGRNLAFFTTLRGRLDHHHSGLLADLQSSVADRSSSNNSVDWIPNNVHCSNYIEHCAFKTRISMTSLVNSTSFQEVVHRMHSQANSLLCKKAFFPGLESEGMEPAEEIREAMEELRVMGHEYQVMEDASLDCCGSGDFTGTFSNPTTAEFDSEGEQGNISQHAGVLEQPSTAPPRFVLSKERYAALRPQSLGDFLRRHKQDKQGERKDSTSPKEVNTPC